MKNIETLKRNEIVTLNRNHSPMSGDLFAAGDKMKFLGWYGGFGNLVRLSRASDNAKLTVLPADIGFATTAPVPVSPVIETAAPKGNEIWDSEHSDESGKSRFVVTHSVLAGKASGTFGMHMTPSEEKEYNSGCAEMASL